MYSVLSKRRRLHEEHVRWKSVVQVESGCSLRSVEQAGVLDASFGAQDGIKLAEKSSSLPL